MSEQIKFIEEEMTQLNGLQKQYLGLQETLGQISVARIKLEQQLEELNVTEDNIRDRFIQTQDMERTFIKNINNKYGDGNLDLETGVFVPNNSKNTPVQEEITNTVVESA